LAHLVTAESPLNFQNYQSTTAYLLINMRPTVKLTTQ